LCYTITPFITELNDNIMRDEERKRLWVLKARFYTINTIMIMGLI
jgi:hypothetical protein